MSNTLKYSHIKKSLKGIITSLILSASQPSCVSLQSMPSAPFPTILKSQHVLSDMERARITIQTQLTFLNCCLLCSLIISPEIYPAF